MIACSFYWERQKLQKVVHGEVRCDPKPCTFEDIGSELVVRAGGCLNRMKQGDQMRIAGFKISRFRGIESCEFTFDKDDVLVCLIGQGDSTKTTILTAIQWALSPSYSLPIEDQDFYRGDISKEICIEVAVRSLPDELLEEKAYGLFLTGEPGFAGINDPYDNGEPCLTVRLRIDSTLEPQWVVYKGDNEKRIGSKDRALIGAASLLGASDSTFSWRRGSDLRRLVGSDEEIDALVISALRKLNESDGSPEIDRVLTGLNDELRNLGVKLDSGSLTSQIQGHRSKIGVPLALFDGETPVELKGAGTRKLVSAAVGMGVTEAGAILLVDEIEIGLEPHRLRGLLQGLREGANADGGQVIVTTHSPVTITELDEFEIVVVHSCKGHTALHRMASRSEGDECARRVLKGCAEAFLAKSIIVCEGKTECGFVRAFDSIGYAPLALYGAVPVDAKGGTNMFAFAELLHGAGYRTCIFMDSDQKGCESEKQHAREVGIPIFDWDDGMSIEGQVFNDVPDETVKELVSFAADEWGKDNVCDGLQANGINLEDIAASTGFITVESRRKIADTAQSHKKLGGWYKRIDLGEELGKKVLSVVHQIEDSRLAKTINELAQWVEEG